MRTPYEQAMDQVRLSDEQKRSLASNLQAAWDAAEKPSYSEAAPIPPAGLGVAASRAPWPLQRPWSLERAASPSRAALATGASQP